MNLLDRVRFPLTPKADVMELVDIIVLETIAVMRKSSSLFIGTKVCVAQLNRAAYYEYAG